MARKPQLPLPCQRERPFLIIIYYKSRIVFVVTLLLTTSFLHRCRVGVLCANENQGFAPPSSSMRFGGIFPPKCTKTFFYHTNYHLVVSHFSTAKGLIERTHSYLSSREHSSPHTHFPMAFSFSLSLRHLTMSLHDHKSPCAAAKAQPLHWKPQLTSKQSGREVLNTSNNNTSFINLTPPGSISKKTRGLNQAPRNGLFLKSLRWVFRTQPSETLHFIYHLKGTGHLWHGSFHTWKHSNWSEENQGGPTTLCVLWFLLLCAPA